MKNLKLVVVAASLAVAGSAVAAGGIVDTVTGFPGRVFSYTWNGTSSVAQATTSAKWAHRVIALAGMGALGYHVLWQGCPKVYAALFGKTEAKPAAAATTSAQ